MKIDKQILFYLICLCFTINTIGQNISKPDSVLYDTLNPKLKLVYKLIGDGKDSYYYTSYYDSAKRRQTRSIYLDGKKRSRGSCNIFRTLKTKTWDKQGRIISKSKQHPFGSTSYTHVTLKKTYNTEGHLIQYKRVKYHVSCFEFRGVYKYKIIDYDTSGKKISKKKMGRLATWRQWKKTGHAVRIKDD
jgi:hypothetical protein